MADLLVALGDANYLDQCRQVFASAYFRGQWRGDMMLLTESTVHDVYLEDFHQKGILVDKYPVWSAFESGYVANPIIYHKLYLFRQKYLQWDSVVFIDADIIINKPLADLPRLRGFNATVCPGCPCFLTLFQPDQYEPAARLLQSWGINQNDRPFNSGIWSMRTQDVIGQDTYSKLHNIAHEYHHMFYLCEQAVLNIHFYGNWSCLDESYNLRPHQGVNPHRALLHSMMRPKPWEENSPLFPIWQHSLESFQKLPNKKGN